MFARSCQIENVTIDRTQIRLTWRSLNMVGDSLLGSVPAGWERTTLGEACNRGGGSIQTGPFGSQLHASDYVPSGIPSIMPQNIGDNRVIEDGIARITADYAERLSRYLVRTGDIVYSRRGDVEKRAWIRSSEDGFAVRVVFASDLADTVKIPPTLPTTLAIQKCGRGSSAMRKARRCLISTPRFCPACHS